MSRRIAATFGAAALLACAGAGHANTVVWIDWESQDTSTVYGTLTVPGEEPFAVTYSKNAGTSFVQTAGGTNYWQPDTAYTNGPIDNGPPDSDIIALVGGTPDVHSVHFSRPILDPVFAILSLGQPRVQVTYNFDAPFAIVSEGLGYWGDGSLTQVDSDTLTGIEGHGLIQFQGAFSEINWTVPVYEFWHAFTVGVAGLAPPEPPPGPTPIPLPAAALPGLLMLAGLGAGSALRRPRKA